MNRGQNINDTVVSTIIPSYNKHHFLKEALFSVLQQSHTNQEVIIVNDYPTLEAREEVEALKKLDDRVHVIHNKTNIGIAPSRNKAIAYSSGKYIAMLDHDDVWHDPDKIKKQLNALKKDTNISVIGTRYYDVDRNLRIIKGRQFPLDDATIRQKLNLAMPGLQSSFVFPAKAMEKIGGFNERISMTDDYEILFRALKVGTMKNLPEYTTLYRAHENTSRDKKNAAIMRVNSLKTLLKNGHSYPNYAKAILVRLLRSYPYSTIRPYLPDTLVEHAKEIRDILLGRTNQSYTHTNYQDEA